MYRAGSPDSAARPLANVNYQQANYEPKYGSGYNDEEYTRQQPPSKKKKWIIVALIVAVIVIAGAVLGGVFGSRASKNTDAKNNSAQANGDSTTGTTTGANSGSSNKGQSTSTAGGAMGTTNPRNALFPEATDSYGNPVYPSSTGSAIIAQPTTLTNNTALTCESDPYTFSNPSSMAVRKEHPLLIAPQYKWDCISKMTSQDPYLSFWHTTILANASLYAAMDPTEYVIDGGYAGDAVALLAPGSGVLDVAREVQLRIKHWGYAYRMTKDTKWVDRAWQELQVAAGNTSQPFGVTGDNWNTQHFLDVGEFTTAFAIAYDWMYDAWTPAQRTAIMWSILTLGLDKGIEVYENAAGYGWWSKSSIEGNWNCVCNNGLIMGALAIANEDPTGTAAKILGHAVPNSASVCAFAPTSDGGVWQETANYWYFGTTGHAQSAASLISATGSDQGLLTNNPGMALSGKYHMYVTGMAGLFNYGDCGPRKFVATANGMMLYGAQYKTPAYTLFQRDRADAPEPMSMLYYDPRVAGQFWENLALDAYFSNSSTAFASMRSSWTDNNGTYIAMKAGVVTGGQTHRDLDGGDFVIDALGQRWAGENGNGQYLANGYFSSEAQNSPRWTYYQKGSQGQNVILIDEANQFVNATPSVTFGTTKEAQTSLNYAVPSGSTAYMKIDTSTYYAGTTSARAIRFLNKRQQILLRDEITSTGSILWRMHTNATVTISSSGTTATLAMGGQTMIATLRQPANGKFTTVEAVRLTGQDSPSLTSGNTDTPNGPIPGVTVLTVALDAGTYDIEVLFNPQWPNLKASDYVNPPNVAIDSWSLTSHN
ncbi:BZ3500_MvSof-1268-A1-R1_Chr7-2g09496 [Microbotryum saponariae]|uniref:BZ3500_MvSof-1268-A1-R1_Chr7-2g09496 protein n=1 Tax=Microbotryum saponariae TaxID=289078 RepID=A0A2X0M0M1_9BASI|nr:BZ3501_MvSof-1269-A2-R1_Chr7-1g09196 [Microbotryum saponariae]SDA02565.1 BZ3500_MvSof-1268-A1-R1_Chr7-2g09496 [Microbotryum saponariae]